MGKYVFPGIGKVHMQDHNPKLHDTQAVQLKRVYYCSQLIMSFSSVLWRVEFIYLFFQINLRHSQGRKENTKFFSEVLVFV